MATKATASKAASAAPRAKPGRPAASEKRGVSRAKIVATAYRLSKTVPLQDLSIVTVARTMGVTPALLHYYIPGREWLTSAVMNTFYRDVLRRWPEETGDWRADLIAAATTMYDQFKSRAGIAAYTILHNRFRVFQIPSDEEPDYGVEVLEQFTARVMAAGRSPQQTGLYAHMLTEFIMSSAYGSVSHRYPSEHREFLAKRTSGLEPGRYPSIEFTGKSVRTLLDAATVFREGLRLYLLGLEHEFEDMLPEV